MEWYFIGLAVLILWQTHSIRKMVEDKYIDTYNKANRIHQILVERYQLNPEDEF